MNIYLGHITLCGKKYQIYIGNNKKISNDSVLVFSNKSIDNQWLKNIELTSREYNGSIVVSDTNRYYLILYLLFSLKRRIYFTDLLSLYNAPIEEIISQVCSKNVQDYLWNNLDSFMNEHKYKWKFINDYPRLYSGKIRVPYNYYSLLDFITASGINLFFKKISHMFEIRTIKFGNAIWRCLFLSFQTGKLKKKYNSLSRIDAKGFSGNIFFKAIDQKEEEFFIKQGHTIFSDISDECSALSIIKNKSNHKELYLLPDEISSQNMLVFPFNANIITLQEADNESIIQTSDINFLIHFACEVIDDLKQCKIIHRDIHPENILVRYDQNKIKGYQLIDFGCAISGNEIRRGIRQRRKNRYVGKTYRFDDIVCNDAYSFLYMIIQLKNFDKKLNGEALNQLIKKCSNQ